MRHFYAVPVITAGSDPGEMPNLPAGTAFVAWYFGTGNQRRALVLVPALLPSAPQRRYFGTEAEVLAYLEENGVPSALQREPFEVWRIPGA